MSDYHNFRVVGEALEIAVPSVSALRFRWQQLVAGYIEATIVGGTYWGCIADPVAVNFFYGHDVAIVSQASILMIGQEVILPRGTADQTYTNANS